MGKARRFIKTIFLTRAAQMCKSFSMSKYSLREILCTGELVVNSPTCIAIILYSISRRSSSSHAKSSLVP